MLAQLSRCLRHANVNIEALFATQDERCTWVYLVARPEGAARRALTSAGYHFLTEQVVTVRMDDRPGALESIADSLSAAGVNINYLYGSGPGSVPFTLVVNTSDSERAAQALEAFDKDRESESPHNKRPEHLHEKVAAGRSTISK